MTYPPRHAVRPSRPRSTCCGCGCVWPFLLVVLLLGGFTLFLYWPSQTYMSGATPRPPNLQDDALQLTCHHLPLTAPEPTMEAAFMLVHHRTTGDIWIVMAFNGQYTWFQPDVMLQETVDLAGQDPEWALRMPVDPTLLISLFDVIPLSRLLALLPYLPTMPFCEAEILHPMRASYATGAAFLTWQEQFQRGRPRTATPPASSQVLPTPTTFLVPTAPVASPTITAIPLPEWGFTNVNANLRAGPGTQYAIAGSALQGTRLAITGRNTEGTWLQLDSGYWIYAPLVDSVLSPLISTPTPVPPITVVAPTPPPATLQPDFATATPDVSMLYAQVLHQINTTRLQHNLMPVVMGSNSAAQTHAQELHDAQYLSHWNQAGLTPYMRYAQAGGLGYSAENVAFIGRLTDQQCVRHSTDDWLTRIFTGLMASPGHRDNILTPHHTRVHLGIVHTCHLMVVVQLFEGDYVAFTLEPQIVNGILSLRGYTQHNTSLQTALGLHWDRLPQPLSRAQLVQSSCYGIGIPVALVLAPPTNPNSHYVDEQTLMEYERCRTPYETSEAFGFPETSQELERLFQQTRNQSRIWESRVVPYYVADILNTDTAEFHVQVDITSLIQTWGPGVYSVLLHGYRNDTPDESILLSTYPIWVR